MVHGAFADGSSYHKVVERLQKKGYQVTAVQNPLTSLDVDVSAVKQVLDRQDGDVVLVGHSWGGVVISEASKHEKVKRLVYLSAIVPDSNENAGQALSRHGASSEGLTPDEKGVIWLPNAQVYQQVMANDLPLNKASVLWATQTPIHAVAFSQAVATPAWQSKPSFYLLIKQDNALPFNVQQSFANMIHAQTKMVNSGHLSMLSQPKVVVQLIEKASQE